MPPNRSRALWWTAPISDAVRGAWGFVVRNVARFAWAVLFANVAVILFGAFVRATGSGAGCGSHWPTCNGDVVPRAPAVATVIELTHRATSGLAFFSVVGLGAAVFRGTEARAPRRAVAVAMLLMLSEVLIGAAIVLLGHVALDPSLLHGVFTELHAGNTFLLLAALTLTAHHLEGGPAVTLTGRGPVVLSLAQAFFGLALTIGSGAIAALGDTLFPAASLREGFAQDISSGSHVFLHIRTLHPVFAMLAFLFVFGGCTSLRARSDASPRTRELAKWTLVALCAQVLVGLVNLWLLVPIATQLLHLACADALFVLLVLLSAHALADAGAAPADGPYRAPALPT